MKSKYIMESEDESLRLDLKATPEILQEQAVWAGIGSGMRVADLGCGPGKTTFHLNRLVQPGGSALGLDVSEQRINYAQANYRAEGLEFLLGDIRGNLGYLGLFDFIWVRFVLEHFRSDSLEIVQNISKILKPGGILCLADLDYNCLTHYGMPEKLEKALYAIMGRLEKGGNFDPYAGRKLYSYLYDLGYGEIDVHLSAHHLFHGLLKTETEYNWRYKVEVAARKSGYDFSEFANGFEGFREEFYEFFRDPRRFTYTPIILARGRKA